VNKVLETVGFDTESTLFFKFLKNFLLINQAVTVLLVF
jgi:hypothetical protein